MENRTLGVVADVQVSCFLEAVFPGGTVISKSYSVGDARGMVLSWLGTWKRKMATQFQYSCLKSSHGVRAKVHRVTKMPDTTKIAQHFSSIGSSQILENISF